MMAAYVSVTLFFVAIIFITFVTSPDRRLQMQYLRAYFVRFSYFQKADIRPYFTPFTIIKWIVLLYLASFLWMYIALRSGVQDMLTELELELDIGTIKLPATAFFKTDFITDTGFSRRKRRQRVTVSVSGSVLTGYTTSMDEIAQAKLSKLTGKAFVFNYLSDVKVLRPAINTYMKRTIAGKQISFFKIETFDNRGPYILVILDEQHRSGDMAALATKIANGLHRNLTNTDQLKVNQVVIKVIDPEAYAANKTIKVIARGQAGSY